MAPAAAAAAWAQCSRSLAAAVAAVASAGASGLSRAWVLTRLSSGRVNPDKEETATKRGGSEERRESAAPPASAPWLGSSRNRSWSTSPGQSEPRAWAPVRFRPSRLLEATCGFGGGGDWQPSGRRPSGSPLQSGQRSLPRISRRLRRPGLASRVSVLTGSPPDGFVPGWLRPWTGSHSRLARGGACWAAGGRLRTGIVADTASGGVWRTPLGRSCAEAADGLSPRCPVSARLHSELWFR